ncbi:MAG: hypothetical protein ACI90U_000618 [Pseudomonadales bacterium]|jgi:hypothetical protein
MSVPVKLRRGVKMLIAAVLILASFLLASAVVLSILQSVFSQGFPKKLYN